MRTFSIPVLVATAGLALGCKDTSTPAPEPTPAEAAPTPTEAAPAEAGANEAAPEPIPLDKAQAPDHAGELVLGDAERPDTATDTVQPTTLEGKDLDPEHLKLKGALIDHLAWTDTFGTSAVFISEGDTDAEKTAIAITHMTREADGSWRPNHMLQSSIACPSWKAQVPHQFGPWSLQDLNEDGVADITLAWSRVCRTDLSPGSHHVAILTGGAPLVWTGATQSTAPEKSPEDVADPWAEHGLKVWGQTANEPAPAAERGAKALLGWEYVGLLPLGAPEDIVRESYGKPEHFDTAIEDSADASIYVQTYFYPKKGIEIRLQAADNAMTNASLAALSVYAPAEFKTRKGIGIGSPAAEVREAYEGHWDASALEAGELVIQQDNQWLIFGLGDDQQVNAIYWGQDVTLPSAED